MQKGRNGDDYIEEEEDDGDDNKASAIELESLTKAVANASVPTPPPTNIVVSLETCQRARRWFYVSHGLAQFSEIAWQFTLTLVLAAYCDNYQSLVLVSTYGFTSSLAVFLGVPLLGKCIDNSNNNSSSKHHYFGYNRLGAGGGRLWTARWFICLENLSVILATVCCYLLLSPRNNHHLFQETDEDDTSDPSASDMESNWNWWRSHFQHVPLNHGSSVLLILIHLLGSAAQLLDQAFLVAMERDWIVVLSRAAADADAAAITATTASPSSHSSLAPPPSPSPSRSSSLSHRKEVEDSSSFSLWLSETNISMKQIDLTSKVAAPTVIGFLLPNLQAQTASVPPGNNPAGNIRQLQLLCVSVGLLNVCALVVEYVCTARVHEWIPALQSSPYYCASSSSDTSDSLLSNKQEAEEEEDEEDLSGKEGENGNWRVKDDDEPSSFASQLPFSSTLSLYFAQPIAWGGVALALLYVNALTFGNGILTTYLLYKGLDLTWIGFLRGMASVIGLLGTFVFQWAVLRKRYSLEATGMASILFQCFCLGATVVSLFLSSPSHTVASLVLLIAGVCLSRIGLWVFDIAVTQMQQQEIPEGIRGRVGGVQQALNSFFNLLSFVTGFLYPDPADFYVYVTAGFLGVAVAVVSFFLGIFLPRRTGGLLSSRES